MKTYELQTDNDSPDTTALVCMAFLKLDSVTYRKTPVLTTEGLYYLNKLSCYDEIIFDYPVRYFALHIRDSSGRDEILYQSDSLVVRVEFPETLKPLPYQNLLFSFEDAAENFDPICIKDVGGLPEQLRSHPIMRCTQTRIGSGYAEYPDGVYYTPMVLYEVSKIGDIPRKTTVSLVIKHEF